MLFAPQRRVLFPFLTHPRPPPLLGTDRNLLKLSQQELEQLPLPLQAEVLAGAAMSLLGGYLLAGSVKPIVMSSGGPCAPPPARARAGCALGMGPGLGCGAAAARAWQQHAQGCFRTVLGAPCVHVIGPLTPQLQPAAAAPGCVCSHPTTVAAPPGRRGTPPHM